MGIKENIAEVRNEIAEACKRAGRSPDSVKLLVATKYADASMIRQVVEAGVTLIGENRVNEAHEKFSRLNGLIKGVEKHFIGTVQRNKARRIVELFDVVESIDSLKVARTLNERAYEQGKVLPVFMEINIAGEESKSGIAPEEADGFYSKLLRMTNLKIKGLMTLAPLTEPENTRKYFRRMKQLADKLALPELSMGMSNDFRIAVEEGSTLVRVGRLIFYG